MKILKLTFITIFAIMLTACTSQFEKAMDSGRKALREGQYEEAAKQFDSALIEEPNNKDAIALMERTNESIKKEQINARHDEFKSAFNPIYEKLKSFDADIDLSKDPFKINNPAAQEKLDMAKQIRIELDDLSAKWSQIGGIEENSYWELSQATDGLISAYENILDPPTQSLSSSRYISERAANLNMPRNIINSSFMDYEVSIGLYEKNMNK